MTVELTNQIQLETQIKQKLSDGQLIIDRAKIYLTSEEFQELSDYILKGGAPLALVTAQKFFDLYLNGYDVNEIHRLNPSFPKGCIYLARLRYSWDQMYHDAMVTMNQRVINKITKAAIEATSIYTDMIAAANKKHGDRLKKYIQTGDESYLKDALSINSISDLAKVIESLQKLSGQDRTFTIKDEREALQGKSANPITLEAGKVEVQTDATQQILNIMAEEKRKKARGENG
jgi:hypothetical protein